jgi:hypothetical protein
VADPAALEPVPQVLRREQRRRRDDDRPELHRGQHDLPDLHAVREHHQDALAALDPVPAQEHRHAIRALGELVVGEAHLGAVLLHDVERAAAVAVGQDVEPVERPVETVERRPAEALVGGLPVLPVLDEEVAGLAEAVGRVHVALRCRAPAAIPAPRLT